MQDPDYKDDNMLTRNGSIPNTKFIKVYNIFYISKYNISKYDIYKLICIYIIL